MIFSVYPDEDSEIEAGGKVSFSAVVFESHEPYQPVADGTCIDWTLTVSGEHVRASQSTTKNGIAIFETELPTLAGAQLVATARFRGQKRQSGELTLIPGRVTTYELNYNPLSKEEDFIPLRLYCADRFGNPANPKRSIWWRLQGPFRLREVDTEGERSHYPVRGAFTVYIPLKELQQETSYPLELLFQIDDVCKVVDLRTGSLRNHIRTYVDPVTGELKPCSK